MIPPTALDRPIWYATSTTDTAPLPLIQNDATDLDTCESLVKNIVRAQGVRSDTNDGTNRRQPQQVFTESLAPKPIFVLQIMNSFRQHCRGHVTSPERRSE